MLPVFVPIFNCLRCTDFRYSCRFNFIHRSCCVVFSENRYVPQLGVKVVKKTLQKHSQMFKQIVGTFITYDKRNEIRELFIENNDIVYLKKRKFKTVAFH